MAPTVILRPAIGATRGVGMALLGAGNMLDKDSRRKIEDVRSGLCRRLQSFPLTRDRNTSDTNGIEKLDAYVIPPLCYQFSRMTTWSTGCILGSIAQEFKESRILGGQGSRASPGALHFYLRKNAHRHLRDHPSLFVHLIAKLRPAQRDKVRRVSNERIVRHIVKI